jgi:hypothetical protein
MPRGWCSGWSSKAPGGVRRPATFWRRRSLASIPDNSRPDLVAEIAFLLLTREPAAEKEAGELVQRTARSFPDQRRSILDRYVRLAEPRRPSRPSGRSFCANYPQGLPATQVSPSQVHTPAHDQYPGQLWVGQRSDS